MEYTQEQVADLMKWAGYDKWFSGVEGHYTWGKKDEAGYSESNPESLLQSWDFIKLLETKMIQEAKIIRKETRYYKDKCVVAYYCENSRDNSWSGHSTTELDAIISALILYREGK